MKSWQILPLGIAVLLLFLFFPLYESLIAGAGAIVVVGTVLVGFLLRPRRDVFYVNTKFRVQEPDEIIGIEHDLLAVRLEVARLWLLFVPTFLAFAFLVVTAGKGSTWKFSLLQTFLGTSQYGGYLFLMGGRLMLLISGRLPLDLDWRTLGASQRYGDKREIGGRERWTYFLRFSRRCR